MYVSLTVKHRCGYQILDLETHKTLMSKIKIEKGFFPVTYDIC